MQCELYVIVAIPHLLIIFAFSVVTREISKVYFYLKYKKKKKIDIYGFSVIVIVDWGLILPCSHLI